MANTEIRLIIFSATKYGETLYSQQKQDRELTGSDNELLIAKFKLSKYMLSYERGWGAQYINHITLCMQHNTILPLL